VENEEVKDKPIPRRKRGVIACKRFDSQVLLPNGDVVICCMDYGNKHVIGNLMTSSYESLFQSEEYNRLLRGFKEESIDTLCRTCDAYAVDVSLFAKIVNPSA